MLILKRRRGQSITIFTAEGETEITFSGVDDFGNDKLVITAPPGVKIMRNELIGRPQGRPADPDPGPPARPPDPPPSKRTDLGDLVRQRRRKRGEDAA
jgi:sRNA-binding carbon storage regulator CsrA